MIRDEQLHKQEHSIIPHITLLFMPSFSLFPPLTLSYALTSIIHLHHSEVCVSALKIKVVSERFRQAEQRVTEADYSVTDYVTGSV